MIIVANHLWTVIGRNYSLLSQNEAINVSCRPESGAAPAGGTAVLLLPEAPASDEI